MSEAIEFVKVTAPGIPRSAEDRTDHFQVGEIVRARSIKCHPDTMAMRLRREFFVKATQEEFTSYNQVDDSEKQFYLAQQAIKENASKQLAVLQKRKDAIDAKAKADYEARFQAKREAAELPPLDPNAGRPPNADLLPPSVKAQMEAAGDGEPDDDEDDDFDLGDEESAAAISLNEEGVPVRDSLTKDDYWTEHLGEGRKAVCPSCKKGHRGKDKLFLCCAS